jgi:hypothetical protein
MSPVDDEAVAVHYSGRVIFNPDGFNLCATDSKNPNIPFYVFRWERTFFEN